LRTKPRTFSVVVGFPAMTACSMSLLPMIRIAVSSKVERAYYDMELFGARIRRDLNFFRRLPLHVVTTL
jgi:hypothetical protein